MRMRVKNDRIGGVTTVQLRQNAEGLLVGLDFCISDKQLRENWCGPRTLMAAHIKQARKMIRDFIAQASV